MADLDLLRRTLVLAERAENPSPNPRVGALVARGKSIVGQGFHEAAGKPHAEVRALEQAGKRAKGATLFVNLEPCNVAGRTPPCTSAIFRAGIARVVFGLRDPTRAGGGGDFLRRKGIRVYQLGAKECRGGNQVWLKNVQTHLPFVTLKLALDSTGSSLPGPGKRWITGVAARRKVGRFRRAQDAIAVGVKTILADDPCLTVRGLKVRSQPVRLVFDPQGRVPGLAKIFRQPGRTILITRQPLRGSGAENLVVKDFQLRLVLARLYAQGIGSILLEGGEFTAGRFLGQGLIDRVLVFQHHAGKNPPLVCGCQVFRGSFRREEVGADTLFKKNLKVW